jgi:hypothetical protein
MSPHDDTRDAGDDPDRNEWHEPAEPDDTDEEDLEEEAPAPRRRRKRPRRERAVVLFADQAGSIIRSGDEELDEDSLPVLNAFRQFLEAERRRAKRQMLLLIAGFTVVLAVLAGGGGWYVWTTLRRVETGLESDKVRSEEDRLAVISNLQNVARAAVTLKKDVLDTRKTSAILQDRVVEQSGELTRLLDTITTLEIQNSKLQRSMKKLDVARDEAAFQPALEPAAPAEPPPPGPEARVAWSNPPMRAASAIPPASEEPVMAPAQPAANNPAVSGGTTPGGVPFRIALPRP